MNQLFVEKYIKDENSEWLVFLHGFGGSTEMWKRQVSYFKDKFNLLVLDLPGHGKSKEGIAGLNIKSFEEIGEMVVEVLKEHSIKVANFMCVSLGTLVLAGILARYPEMVNSAILCGAIAGCVKGIEILLRMGNKIKFCFSYTFLLNFFSYAFMPLKSHSLSRDFFRKSGRLLGRKEFMAWANLLITDMRALKKLKINPKNILFIMGDEDFTFLKGVKNKLQDFTNSKLEIFKHCGHVCNLQQAQHFNDVSLKFLESVI